MIIRTIWVSPTDWDEAYMVDAWDEYTVEANAGGWEEALAKARNENNELRVIDLECSGDALRAAFSVPTVPATVKRTEGDNQA